jgi:hypothetical protein
MLSASGSADPLIPGFATLHPGYDPGNTRVPPGEVEPNRNDGVTIRRHMLK